MTSRLRAGQPFFDRYQYAQVCERCGERSLYVTSDERTAARLRLYCPKCQALTWHTIHQLPEAFR